MMRLTSVPIRQLLAVVISGCLFATAAAQNGAERSIRVPNSRSPRVAQTPHEPIIDQPSMDGVEIEDSEAFPHEYGYDASCGLNCNRCGGGGCDLSWFSAEYLMYWSSGMDIPPLVTTSRLLDDAGVLGRPTTSILYGNEGILQDMRSGARFTFGNWLDCCKTTGIEFEYFFLPEISERFQASGFGDPIIMRPFFNALADMQDAEIVSFPGELGGAITIDATSEIHGGGVRVLRNLYEGSHCPVDQCGHLQCGAASTRIQMIAGYRFIKMTEHLAINEDLVSLDTAAQGAFDVNDIFSTDNEFHGGELGLQWQMARNCWEFSLLAKVAMGGTRQDVSIRGFTVISPEGQPSSTEQGGLLAQVSNIGDYSRHKFGVVSEFGTTLKYHVTPRLLFSTGYTMILWNNVVRPGEQIDFRVNPNLIPPAAPGGPALPEFAFNDTDFWLQGLRLGAEFRW